ncbi:MAG: hypothetical protein ACRDF4_10605, partial [Rhabdochlamydiaceae bacterium]
GQTFTTYNLEVDGFHTYFVAPIGSRNGAAGVWVHNESEGMICKNAIKAAAEAGIRDIRSGAVKGIDEFLAKKTRGLSEKEIQAITTEYISQTEQELGKLATQASKQVVRKEGESAAAWGTRVHARLKELIIQSGRSDLRGEVSFIGGKEFDYGTKGSIRADAILVNEQGNAIAVFDLKTGKAILSEIRKKILMNATGAGIAKEIRP